MHALFSLFFALIVVGAVAHGRHRYHDRRPWVQRRLYRRRTRTYFIGIDAIKWDYYPVFANNRSLNAGPNGDRCTNGPFADDQLLFVGSGKPLQGFTPTSVYDKIVFREYTDASFTRLKIRRKDEEHLALLGPLLRVAAGENLVVKLRGLPKSQVVDPTQSEFGFEIDGLHPKWKVRPVKPGEIVTHRYEVGAANAPNSFVDSQMLLYRGTVGSGPDGSAGIYLGLLGGAIVYKAGGLRNDGRPRGLNTELVTILWVANENKGGEEGDEEEGNLMHSINGRVYCSLPGLDMVKDKPTRWYFGAVGNEVDVHVAHIHGIVGMNAGGQHTDSIRLLPGVTSSVQMIPDNVGTWLYHCHINDHLHAGMVVLATVKSDGSKQVSTVAKNARERVYYVQAEDVIWDYAPLGRNMCDNREYNDDELIFVKDRFPISLASGGTGFGIGSKYLKTRYFEYTDATFSKRVQRTNDMQHLGVMGPVLRARVGEVIVVHFRNKGRERVSMHPHGVFYTKAHEGAPYNDGTSGTDTNDDAIPTGGSHTYRWEVPERAGPGPGERQDAKLWMYHSHRNEILDTYAGLFGVLLIVSNFEKYHADTLLPCDGSREAFIHMTVMNENDSFHADENAKRANRALSPAKLDELKENEVFEESNLMHSINGFLYCNSPVLQLHQDVPTQFYFYALGSEVDLHTPQVGNEVLQLDFEATRGSGTLLAGSFSSAVVVPRHVGNNELRCNVNDHVIAGMRMRYRVLPHGKTLARPHRKIVTHYIAAEEVAWDYTPLGKDGCNGRPFGVDEKVFTMPGNFTPGSKYFKAQYREYWGPDFRHLKNHKRDAFAGIVGPLLHFEVGETVKIVFRNKLTFAANINFVGIQLVEGKLGEVAVGGQATYIYKVRAESGPSKSDPSAVPFLYYSSVDNIAHTAAGLTGVFGITRRNGLRKKSRLPRDTYQAYPLLLNIFRENESPLIEKSLKAFSKMPNRITESKLASLREDEVWLESNAMHSINGFLYCNNPTLRGRLGSKVRFYVFGYGSESSMHSPIWKGQVIKREVKRGNAADGIQILPYNAETADVLLKAKGLWAIVCGVADHVLGGMKARLRVN